MALEPPPAPVEVRGDRLLLRRAFTNLVDNAREAGASRVTIRWQRAGERAAITVEDDGPGVPVEVRERLFDPYVTTKAHGTGLGLAIVKKTILEHGGAIRLDPSARGARFVVELPLSSS